MSCIIWGLFNATIERCPSRAAPIESVAFKAAVGKLPTGMKRRGSVHLFATRPFLGGTDPCQHPPYFRQAATLRSGPQLRMADRLHHPSRRGQRYRQGAASAGRTRGSTCRRTSRLTAQQASCATISQPGLEVSTNRRRPHQAEHPFRRFVWSGQRKPSEIRPPKC